MQSPPHPLPKQAAPSNLLWDAPAVVFLTWLGSDPMGRWSYQTLRSFNNKHLTFITAYRVCQNQWSGPLTAYEQQRTYLITQNDKLSNNPPKAMLSSLTQFIKTLTKANHEVSVMWDANSLLSDGDIITFTTNSSLSNLHLKNNFPPSANTSSHGRRIDFSFGTSLFQSAFRRGGILSFHNSPFSDHRALYLDLNEATLFRDSSTDPTAPSQRLLRLKNLSQCRKYLSLVHEHLSSHHVFDRFSHLTSLASSSALLSQITRVYESIDRGITAALLTTERRTSKAAYGFPWPPTLMKHGQNFLFWKRRCSDCCTYGDSLASYPNPLELQHTDKSDILTNRTNLQYNRNHLLAARRDLNECHQRSAELRTKHLDERAEAASRNSDTQAATALNNILKAEEIRTTFQKLRRHAKGRSDSFPSSTS